jgi:hypothetical protein
MVKKEKGLGRRVSILKVRATFVGKSRREGVDKGKQAEEGKTQLKDPR